MFAVLKSFNPKQYYQWFVPLHKLHHVNLCINYAEETS